MFFCAVSVAILAAVHMLCTRRVLGTKNQPGTLRRFISVYKQFDLTFELYSMESSEIIDLLPTEFDKFLV